MTGRSIEEVLADHQRLGLLGTMSVSEAISHARQLTPVLPANARVLDLGSGGGLPGLVLAVDRPDLVVELLDRRGKRADQLRRAASALGVVERVVVSDRTVESRVQDGDPSTFDAVVARAFGPLIWARAWAAAFCRTGGLVAISVAPTERAGIRDVVTTDGLRWREFAGSWAIWERTDQVVDVTRPRRPRATRQVPRETSP